MLQLGHFPKFDRIEYENSDQIENEMHHFQLTYQQFSNRLLVWVYLF